MRIDDIGAATQIAKPAHPAQNLRDDVRERSGQCHAHHGAFGYVLQTYPASVPDASRFDRDRARINTTVTVIDTVDGPHSEEFQQLRPRQRRPVTQFENQPVRHAVRRTSTHCQRRQPVAILSLIHI